MSSPSIDELALLADACAFIFTGATTRASPSAEEAHPPDTESVVVTVDDVIKVPAGLRGLAGREVVVHLLHRLPAGHYVFFADLVAVGEQIAVTERAHLEGRERAVAVAALERGYILRMAPRLEAASLVALGTIGQVRPLLSPADQRGKVPWATARFEIDQVLKGKGRSRHATLVGPLHVSKRLPRAPALRGGLHAILLLQRPPHDAIADLPEDDRAAALFIADPNDIQPPAQLAALEKILSGPAKE